jgi:eukaryotic-like serine/threonine-protein kinase
MIGQTFSHYKILQKLGEGGMGVVYKAQDTKLLRPVALKFLSPELTRDQDAKQRFVREARAASALDHPNIAVVHDIDETDDGRSFICMAYYEGHTLAANIAQKPFALADAVRIALQIASGLEVAHDSGIVHRDIKPSNIIITPQGEVKIVDFGLAKLSEQARETRTQITGGTAAYMSPEQILGGEADARSDLFSLGVVFYETITGKRPFPGEHEAAIYYSIVNAEPIPPSALCPEISSELEKIILHLLEKDPKKRYQHASEVVLDLKHYLGEKPTARPIKHLRKALYGRYPVAIVVGAVVIVASGILYFAGIIGQLMGGGETPADMVLAVMRFDVSDSTKLALTSGLYENFVDKISTMKRIRSSLSVVVSADMRKVERVRDAYRDYGATEALLTRFNWQAEKVIVRMSLADGKSSTEREFRTFEASAEKLGELEDQMVRTAAELIGITNRTSDLSRLSIGESKDDKARELYLRARAHLLDYSVRDHLDSAIALLHRALTQDSRFPVALAALGEAYWRMYEATRDTQWVSSAISACRKAFALDDNIAPLHTTLGMIYKVTKQTEEAIAEFERSLAIDSMSVDAYRELGAALALKGDSAKALAAYKKAIALQPNDWRGYNSLGGYYFFAHRYEDAIAMWKRVLDLAPYNKFGYNNLGVVYFQLGRWSEGSQYFEYSVQRAPDSNYVAYQNLGTMYYYDGLFERSADSYRMADQIARHKDYGVLAGLGAAYRAMGSQKLAQEIYEEAVRLAEGQLKVRPNDAMLISRIGELYADVGRKAEARAAALKALSLAPNNGTVLRRTGMMYELLGDRQEALRLFARAVEKNDPLIEIRYSPEMKSLREDQRFQKLLNESRDRK